LVVQHKMVSRGGGGVNGKPNTQITQKKSTKTLKKAGFWGGWGIVTKGLWVLVPRKTGKHTKNVDCLGTRKQKRFRLVVGKSVKWCQKNPLSVVFVFFANR